MIYLNDLIKSYSFILDSAHHSGFEYQVYIVRKINNKLYSVVFNKNIKHIVLKIENVINQIMEIDDTKKVINGTIIYCSVPKVKPKRIKPLK